MSEVSSLLSIGSSRSDMIMFIMLIASVISIMWFIKYMYMKYSINGKLLQKNDYDTIDTVQLRENLSSIISTFDSNKNNIIESNNASNIERLVLLHNDNHKNIADTMAFECKFSLVEPYELLEVSNNFLKLLNYNEFNDLVKSYKIRKEIHKKYSSYKNDITMNDILKDYSDITLGINDIFNISNNDMTILKDSIASDKYNNTLTLIIKEGKMELKTDVMDAFIRVCYNAYLDFVDKDNKYILIKFRIHKIAPMINPYGSILHSNAYKEVMNNILLDLSFPLILVNNNGVKFLNKCSCDWLNIPYVATEKLESENNINSIDEVFAKISNELPKIIKDCIKSSNCTGFYREYIFDIKDQYLGNERNLNSITFNNAPREIIMIGKPFTNKYNERELMITMHDADTLHKYIQLTNNKEENNVEYVIDRKDDVISKYIQDVSDANRYFKSFFENTNMIGFGRVNMDTYEILMCNDYFESLFKYDEYKDRYLAILMDIIQGFEHDDNGRLYIHNVSFKDRDLRIIFTYNIDITDIVIMEKTSRARFVSNRSIDFIGKLYNHSDLPIIIVNKKAEILCKNDVFISMFGNNKSMLEDTNKKKGRKVKQIYDSLLSYIPESDKAKVKRAINDAIKHHTINLVNSIQINDKDSMICKLECIESYDIVNNDEFITITFYPKN